MIAGAYSTRKAAGMERDLTTLRYQAASTGTGTLAVTIEELNAVQRALDAEREKVKAEQEQWEIQAREGGRLKDQLTQLQAQLRQLVEALPVVMGSVPDETILDLWESDAITFEALRGLLVYRAALAAQGAGKGVGQSIPELMKAMKAVKGMHD